MNLELKLKIGLGLANLLAMSVMLGIVAESLPKSNELTCLGNYLIYTLCVGTVAVVVSVILDFFVNKAGPLESLLQPFQFRSRRTMTRSLRMRGSIALSA